MAKIRHIDWLKFRLNCAFFINAGPKKKPKESDQLWKIVAAAIVILAIATAAVYLVGSKKSKTDNVKTDGKDPKTSKEKPVNDKTESRSKSSKKTQDKVKKKAVKKESQEQITNNYDKTISKELDETEKLLKAKKSLEQAKSAFEKLVRNHPNSPRAMYGLARSLDDLADMRRSNQILQEAIDTFEKVGKVKDCPIALKRKAVLRQAERVSFLGKTHLAVHALENLAQELPQDLEIWNKLGIQCLMSGNQNKAKKAFKQVNYCKLF